jgi:acetone carboxylase gamma subunit
MKPRVFKSIYREMVYFRLSGQNPLLQLKLENPIHLEENVRYYLALTGFCFHNYFYNLKAHASISFQGEENDLQTFSISPTFLTLETLHKKIREFLVEKSLVVSADEAKKFRLFRNLNSKVVIVSPIKCHISNGLRRFLGFKELEKDKVEYETEYIADNVVSVYEENNKSQIRPFNTIEVHCDLVEHSFINHRDHWHKHDNSSLLYHCSPREHKDKIYEKPSVLNYMPLKSGTLVISNINVYLTDENYVPLQNALSDYIVYLKLVSASELN